MKGIRSPHGSVLIFNRSGVLSTRESGRGAEFRDGWQVQASEQLLKMLKGKFSALGVSAEGASGYDVKGAQKNVSTQAGLRTGWHTRRCLSP